MAETFEGKVVLITGAGGRIGPGLAEIFHAAGAKVALGDLRQDAVDRLAADLGGRTNPLRGSGLVGGDCVRCPTPQL